MLTRTANADWEGSISSIELDVRGRVPGVDQARFEKAAKTAERNCRFRRRTRQPRIELRAKLEG